MVTAAKHACRAAPGLGLLGGVAGLSVLVAGRVPYVNALILAIIIGAFIVNIVGLPDWVAPGVETHGLFLKTGIVLLGTQVAIGQVLARGPTLLLLVTATVGCGVLFVELLSRSFLPVDEKTGSLLAAGSSICGVSAVVAVASGIDADETDIAFVAATILLFDALTLVAFPLIGTILALPDEAFGVWAGLSMFSTGPVTAAGFTYSEVAGQWATMTKLIRNSLIGGVVVGYSLYYASGAAASEVSASSRRDIMTRFPKFMLGFLALMVIANVGVLSPGDIETLGQLPDWLFLLAFVGLGTEIKLSAIRDTGPRPILIVLLYLMVIGALTLGAALVFV